MFFMFHVFIFSCAYWSSGCQLWRNVYLSLLPIFWLPFVVVVWLLSCMNCLCILEMKFLSVTLFANTSSKFTGSFVLFMISSGGWDSKESTCNARDPGLISGSGRSPGQRNGNPRQYSCLENAMDREAWQTTVHGVTKSWIRLSNIHFHFAVQKLLTDPICLVLLWFLLPWKTDPDFSLNMYHIYMQLMNLKVPGLIIS